MSNDDVNRHISAAEDVLLSIRSHPGNGHGEPVWSNVSALATLSLAHTALAEHYLRAAPPELEDL